MHIMVIPEGELYRVHVGGKAIREPMNYDEAHQLAEFIRDAEMNEGMGSSLALQHGLDD